ncbi:MAG: NusG domain II-containing protein [Oscillospiraceae bacterium]|nr:NusG domain II-containing protein [Oscillospiraceae bacterium]
MKTRYWILNTVGVFVIAIVVLLVFGNSPADTALVYQKGELIRTIDLTDVAEPYGFTVECETGSNHILVDKGRICIAQSDCPDGQCIYQGWVGGGGAPLVCLPHELVIELSSGSAPAASEVDAVVG